MLTLNNEIKEQLEALSARLSRFDKVDRKLFRIVLWLCLGLILCVVAQYFVSPVMSSMHVPESLVKLTNGAETGGVAGIEPTLGKGMFDAMTGAIPRLMSIMLFLSAMFQGIVRGINVSTIITLSLGLILGALPGLLGGDEAALQYKNQPLVSAIVDHDMSEPIDLSYIAKVKSPDERYILAQAAVLSKAHYPADFFKSVADELQTGTKGLFEPEFGAQHAIEVAGYGHPVTPQVVERADKLSFYRSILTTLFGSVTIGALGLASCLLGLSVLRMSIRRRLWAIEDLVGAHGPNSGQAATSRIQECHSPANNADGNTIRQHDLVENKDHI